MLSPYTGQWTFDEAAHLLRRTIFGPTKSRIQQAVDEGFDATFATLFAEPAVVDPPIYYDFEDDPEAGIGETWVDKPLDGSVTGIIHDGHPQPGTYTITQAQAAWNYLTVVEDQSNGVHNPAYTKALIKNSIEALD